jgi:hypothetical protein
VRTVYIVFNPDYCEQNTPLRVFPNEDAAIEWALDQDQQATSANERAEHIDHTPYTIVECEMET